MPMIDVYAAAGTFARPHDLAVALATTLMRVEGVPDIPMFRQNTAAFIHDLPSGNLANVDGDSDRIRVQVLTNADALDRDQQLAAVAELTRVVIDAAETSVDPSQVWVLLTEAVQGGWGLAGRANTNDDLVSAARAELARIHGAGESA